MLRKPASLGARLSARAGAELERLTFRPETLPPDFVLLLALLPPVGAGVLLFRRPALEILAIALGIGGAVVLGTRLLRRPVGISPVLAAVAGVALCGPGTLLLWPVLIALLAAVLEGVRRRLVPGAAVSTGLLAYAAVFLTTGGATAYYVKPPAMLHFPEPIQQWSRYYGGANGFLDPVTLYVGNVAGPVFATSLLAIAVSIAWLWYARRISLAVLFAFGIGAAALALAVHWDPVFQLDSGPTWFVAGLLFADRMLLPANRLGRTLLGLAAGIIGFALRTGDFYVEAIFLTFAALQLSSAFVTGVARFLAGLLPRRGGRRPQARKGQASA